MKTTPKTLINSDVYGFTLSSISGGKSLKRLREEVFPHYLVSVARVAFQACGIDHSAISPL